MNRQQLLEEVRERLENFVTKAEAKEPLKIADVDYVALDALDLNDARTANAVAAAIVRFKGGGYVPFTSRYPWRTTGIRFTEEEVLRLLAWHRDRAQFNYPDEADYELAWRLGKALWSNAL